MSAKPELMKSYASSLQKIANLPRYRHPADLVNPDVRPISQQRLEINGNLEFGFQKYPSTLQEKLIQNLLTTKKTFLSSSVTNKNKIAQAQYDHWKNYLQERVNSLPNTLRIEEQRRQKVYESYLIAKQRNHEQMQLAKTVKLFYQISMGFKFDIAIHPQVMLRMVYPHYGYLNNYKEQRLPFEDYIKFLEEMIAVSQLYSEGSTLHGSELLSFVFWKSYSSTPTLSISKFCELLSLFKFNTKPQTVEQDLSYHLKDRIGEIKQGNPVRFDFWRQLFLERGL